MGRGILGLAIYLLKPKIFGIENLALKDGVLNPFKISARFSIIFLICYPHQQQQWRHTANLLSKLAYFVNIIPTPSGL